MAVLFESLKPLSVGFTRASELVGISKNSLRRMAKSGQIRTVRLGRRRVVAYESLRDLIAGGGEKRDAATEAR